LSFRFPEDPERRIVPAVRIMGVWLGVLVLVAGCGPLNAPTLADPTHITRLTTVLVVVPVETGAFTVMNARTQTNSGATYGAMFGLLGLAIAGTVDASVKSSSDTRDTDLVTKSGRPVDARGAFIDAIRAAVQRAGRTGIQVADRGEPASVSGRYDAVATLRIAEWGLRRIGEGDPATVAGFVDVDATLTRSADKEVLWSERESVLGKGRAPIATYQTDGEALRREIEQTFAAAGHRMAMQILYPRSAR
jgi:hypothetical protein